MARRTKEGRQGKRTCPECGGSLRRATRAIDYTYKGETITVKQPGWWCEACDEAVLEPADIAETEPALKALKAKVDGLLTPEEVRACREAIGLSQRRAGDILGGGPRAFQKYESGKVSVSLPMSNLLRVLALQPELLGTIPAATTAGAQKQRRSAPSAPAGSNRWR
jgi:HTH-type transcriptional regulator/antitoxin MqsA